MITVSNIVNANEVELLCMTYEIFLQDIDDALDNIEEKRKKHVERARETLIVLTENLDLNIAIAKDIFKIYIYIQNLLINHWTENERLKEVKTLITMLLEGYEKTKSQHIGKKPIMQNTQNIYAGMTYGRGYLEEQTYDSIDRGFKA